MQRIESTHPTRRALLTGATVAGIAAMTAIPARAGQPDADFFALADQFNRLRRDEVKAKATVKRAESKAEPLESAWEQAKAAYEAAGSVSPPKSWTQAVGERAKDLDGDAAARAIVDGLNGWFDRPEVLALKAKSEQAFSIYWDYRAKHVDHLIDAHDRVLGLLDSCFELIRTFPVTSLAGLTAKLECLAAYDLCGPLTDQEDDYAAEVNAVARILLADAVRVGGSRS